MLTFESKDNYFLIENLKFKKNIKNFPPVCWAKFRHSYKNTIDYQLL